MNSSQSTRPRPIRAVLTAFMLCDCLTRPSDAIREPDKRRQARLLSSFLLVLLVSMGVVVAPYLTGHTPYDRYFNVPAIMLGVGGVLYLLSRTRHYTLTAFLSVIMTALATFAISIPTPDPGAINLLVYLVIPVLFSSMLLPVRVTVVIVVLQIVSMFAYDAYFSEVSLDNNWTTFVSTVSLLILFSMRHHDLIERDRQAQLAEKEQRYRALVELAPVPIAVCTIDAIAFANHAGLALIGARSMDDLSSTHPRDLAAPDHQEIVAQIIADLGRNTTAVQCEIQLRTLHGEIRDVQLTALPIDYMGQLAAQIILVDTTAYQQAQRALHASEERFRLIAQVNNDALYDVNLNNGDVWCKNGQRHLLDENEKDYAQVLARVSPEHREQVAANAKAIMRDPQQPRWQAEYAFLTPDGTYRDVINRAFILRDDTGRSYRLIGAITDVTEQKRAERAEREQRNLAEALVDIATVINSTLEIDYMLDAILKTVERLVPFEGASITLIGEDNIARITRRYHTDPHVSLHTINTVALPVDELYDLQQMIATQQPFIIEDTHQSEHWVTFPETAWVRSHIAMPICTGSTTIGFLHLASAQPNTFTGVHARRLETLVTQLAIALNNAHLYATVRQHAHDLEMRVRARTAELQQTTERVEAILNNSSDAILLIDCGGHIQQANHTAHTLMRHTPDTLCGAHLTGIVEAASAGDLSHALHTVRQAGQPAHLEVIARRQDGETFHADIGLSPVTTDSGTVNGIVGTLRDITPHKEAERNLRHALQKERELNELKSRFVIMASHEFRTPLATIQATADILRHYSARMSTHQQQDNFDKIQRHIGHMTDLLDDVLLAGRLESGALPLERQPVTLAPFLREIAEDFQKITPCHTFQIDGAPSDVQARVDPRLLRQVVTNLLSNAVKYSPESSTVRFCLVCDPDCVTFSVSDQGVGIPASDHEHLFEIFHRGANVEAIPGTGLGLAITRQAVELHGGAITFESVEGSGTTFTVTIPVVPTED